MSERFAVPSSSEAYLCRENSGLIHTEMCLFCMYYQFSRPTFHGDGANLWWQSFPTSIEHCTCSFYGAPSEGF